MKPGTYPVRGKFHGEPTPLVKVEVTSEGTAKFTFGDLSFEYRARPRSPFPERLSPAKVDAVDGATARSIAHAAFTAADKAAKEPEPAPADDNGDLDLDDIVIGGIRGRTLGSQEGAFTRHTS